MSGAEIYLKLKGFFEDKISIPVKKALNNIGAWAKNAGQALGSLNNILDSVGGTAGKVISSIGNVFSVFTKIGPVGAIVAGISAAVAIFTSRAQAAAEAAVELQRRLGEAVRQKFEAVKSAELERISKALDDLTKRQDLSVTKIPFCHTFSSNVQSCCALHISLENH